MARIIDYDDEQFRRMWEQMSPRRRMQALKGQYRMAGRKFRAQAVAELRRSGIHTSRDLEKGVRLLVFKQTPGFRVTVGTQGRGKNAKGYHTNRRGLEKPVLLWAEDGTQARARRTRRLTGRMASTGRMPALLFLDKAKQAYAGTVNDQIRDYLMTSTQRIALRYGCTN